MAGITNYLADALMDLYLSAVAYTNPATIAIGLSTTNPGAAGSMAGEPTTSNGYNRVTLAKDNATIWSAAAAGAKVNGHGAITFPTSSGAWSTGASALAYWFIADSATPGAGNVLLYGTCTPSIDAVNATGITISIPVSQLNIAMA
jgi:hypothetical protein